MDEQTKPAEKVEEVKSESLPSSSESTNSASMSGEEKSKGGKNKILIGCGIALVLALCLLCIAGVLGIGGGLSSLSNFFQNSTAIVEYNNSLVDERDQAIEQLYEATDAFYYALDLTEVETKVAALDEAVSQARDDINALEVPAGAEELKNLNMQYLDKLDDISTFLKNTMEETESVYFDETAYDQYEQMLTEVDALNIEIAEKLNEIVGYEAVPQSDIDSLKETE